MFGIGNKKEKQPSKEVLDAAYTLAKEPTYKPEEESTFHFMPSVVKTHYHESKKAHTTGKLIIVVGGVFVLAAFAGLVFYILKPVPNKKQPIADNGQAKQEEVATTSPTTEEVVATTSTTTEIVVEVATTTASSSISTEATSTASSTIALASTTQEELEASTTQVVAPVLDTDTDGDGLLDAEELVFGTKVDQVDSDKDGFGDLVEIKRGYNPAGVGKISASKGFKKFENANFMISYPTFWEPKASDNDLVVFEIADNQMVQISIQPNVESYSAVEWYRMQVSNKPIDNSQLSHGKDINSNTLWDAVMAENGLTYYVVDALRQNVVTVSYNLGPSNKIRYPIVFKLMMESYKPL